MAKLTLKTAKKAVGIGSYFEKTIKFRDAEGNDFEGEILVKVLNSHEIKHITDVLKLKKDEKWTLSQYRDAMLHQAIFEDEDKPFFPKLEDTGTIADEIKVAMYDAADEVINFTGKHWISKEKKNSGVNSSSTASADEQSKKPSGT